MKKLMDFKDLYKEIRQYADEHCDGNFSFAVRQLIRKGLASE